jgi:hypothetical protein
MKVASTVRRGAVGKGLLNCEQYLAGRLPYRASRHGTVDPSETEEDLSAMVLGHQTHLKAKAVGESSMSGKPRRGEAAKLRARQGPDGKVKAKLPEPECPNCNPSGQKRRISDCLSEPQVNPDWGSRSDWLSVKPKHSWGGWPAYNGLNKDTKWAPKPS